MRPLRLEDHEPDELVCKCSTCPRAGGRFRFYGKKGRKPDYCSGRCRTRAHRARTAAAKLRAAVEAAPPEAVAEVRRVVEAVVERRRGDS